MSGIHRLVAADNKGMVEPTNTALAEESLESQGSSEEVSETKAPNQE